MSEQKPMIDLPVLVIGAGPCGLMMASELARQGVRCRIIDKAPRPSEYSKALAIHARTLEIFEKLGIAERFVSAGVKAHGVRVYAERKCIAHVSFDELESRYNFVLMIPQDETERLLGEHLESLGLAVERSVELTGFTQDANAVTATLKRSDGSQERCRGEYIVGCDGAHSSVRHILNLGFEGAEYEESFALADIGIESNLPDDEITGFGGEKGLVFFFPITHGRYRLIADVESFKPGTEPTVEELQNIIDSQCHIATRLHDPKWTAYFKIHRRQANAYRVGRAFIAGDAAHIHSPAGGQGMNTGFQDAYNLAWKIALVMKGIALPALLDSYATERHAVGRQVLKVTDAMTRIMEFRNPVATSIRNRLAPILSGLPFFQQRARRTMAELGVNYRESPIVGEYHEGLFQSFAAFSGGPHAGDRVPDGDGLGTADGKTVRLYEMLRDDNHKLLLLGGAEAKSDDYRRLVSIGRQVADKYGNNLTSYIVTITGALPSNLAWDGRVIHDERGTLHRALSALSPCLYVIRPDGYVGYRSFPPELAPLMEFFARIFV